MPRPVNRPRIGGGHAVRHRGGEVGDNAALVGHRPLPILPRVACRSAPRVAERLAVAPARLCLSGVARDVEVAEQLEALLGGQVDAHLVCLLRGLDGREQILEPADPVTQQPLLAIEVRERVGGGVVKQRRDVIEGQAELAVGEDPVQPLEVRG